MDRQRVIRKQAGYSSKKLVISEFLNRDEISKLSERLSETRQKLYDIAKPYNLKFGYPTQKANQELWNIIWFECVWALAWLSYSTECGADGDEFELHEEFFNRQDAALSDAIDAVSKLLEIDKHFPQSIGDCISHAISSSFWPEGKDFCAEYLDPNSESGIQSYQTPYRETHFIENQLALRCGFESEYFLSNLKNMLIEFKNARINPNHHQLGCLRIRSFIDRKTRSSFNIEEIGLAARLTLRFREFSDGRYIVSHYPGQGVPDFGKPHWSLVADLVNLTLNLSSPTTPESLKARWHKLTKKYDVLIDPWPRPATRQPVRVYEPDIDLPA